MKMYSYKGCGTCKKAIKWLDARGVEYELLAIRETPPSVNELKQALAAKGQVKALFNTSGMDYRSLGMKDKLPTMSDEEAVELLASNGNLIKRPFVLVGDSVLVGFKEEQWELAF